MLVDSHCHLNYEDFKEDRDSVIKRAFAAGVSTMLTINTRLSEALELQKIADQYSDIYCTVGVHPHDAQDYDVPDLVDKLVELSQHPKVVGLGETGLDFYYEHSPKEAQQRAFKAHLEAAKQLDLPVVIHTREADDETINCLKPYAGQVRGVFHCFSGGMDLAQQGLDFGFMISFSGIITFKKAEELREVVKQVPLEKILVETDSPFLAPVPHRGKRNEPAFTMLVAEKVAELKELSVDEVAKATTNNFYELFNRVRPVKIDGEG